MSIEVPIKEPHRDFLDRMMKEHDLSNHQEVVSALVAFASKDDAQANEDIFEYRCVGECYQNDYSAPMEVSDEAIDYLKRMIEEHDLGDYDTEAEQLGKAVRCLINYAEEGDNPKTIFAK
ncbi:MAG: hypothetical protein AAF560_13065 [Acidobacteriota bacterium]